MQTAAKRKVGCYYNVNEGQRKTDNVFLYFPQSNPQQAFLFTDNAVVKLKGLPGFQQRFGRAQNDQITTKLFKVQLAGEKLQ